MSARTLHHFAIIAAFALPALGCAADAPPVCSSLPGTAEEIAATPRPDENLELLALRLSDGVAADQAVYDRLERDITAIRAKAPGMGEIRYFAPYFDSLLVAFEEASFAQLKAGTFKTWDCLNAYYGVAKVTPSTRGSATVTFNGRYNLFALEKLYEQVPGVRFAEPVMPLGDGPTIYVTPEGDTWHYVFNDASGDCPLGCTEIKAHYFVVQANKRQPQLVGTWNSASSEEAPAWVETYLRGTSQRWRQRPAP